MPSCPSVPIDLSAPLGDEMHEALARALHADAFALDTATGAPIVVHHDDVVRLAHDRHLPGVGLSMFDLMAVGDGPLRRWYRALMFTNEGADHDRLRRLVVRAFTPGAVEDLRGYAATVARRSLAPLANDGSGDVAAALRLLPLHVMCRLLGVPEGDVTRLEPWVDALSVTFGYMSPEQVEAATSAIGDLLLYVAGLVRDRQTVPRSDFVTALLAPAGDGASLTVDEVVDLVASLLVGGHETTAAQLGCSLLTLYRHPDELHRLEQNRSLLASAVTETIRYEPTIGFVPRTTAATVEVRNGEIPPGRLLFLCSASANRDAGAWSDPDRFDVARFVDGTAPRVLTFGAGAHHCLGAALAQLTVAEGMRATLDAGAFRLEQDPGTIEWRTVLGRFPAGVHVQRRD